MSGTGRIAAVRSERNVAAVCLGRHLELNCADYIAAFSRGGLRTAARSEEQGTDMRRSAVTGGSSGIGKAIALKLMDAGSEVTVLDIREPDFAVRCWIEADLSTPEAARRAVSKLERPIDVFVNSAGLPPREGLERDVLAVNFLGLVAATEAVLPSLADGASIISVASKAGSQWRANIGQVKALLGIRSISELGSFVEEHGVNHVRAYDLSKEAVIVWSISQLEALLPRGIRINTVSPAAVETRLLPEFVTAFQDRGAADMIKRIGRPASPDEVADAVAFLASERASWINGSDLPVDGGTAALVVCDTLLKDVG